MIAKLSFHAIQRLSTVLLACFLVVMMFVSSQPVRATDTSKSNFTTNYYYNSLISDSEFVSIDNYNQQSIQAFFDSKSSYLKDFVDNGRSASQIIYDAAHGHGDASGTLNGIAIDGSTGTVSPKVILVTLQKEQSLITLTQADRDANVDNYNNRLDRAMGYGCPDSGGCNDAYKGFTKQVENAAWQLRYNYERAQGHGFSDYQVNQTTTYSDPSGSYSVTHANRATAALYRYTPHVFNGNYNFWKLTNEWFGATPPPPLPPSTNDTGAVTSKTFRDDYKIESTKTQASRVFFRDKEIAGSDAVHWSIEFTPDIGSHTYTVQYKDGAGNVTDTKDITIDRHRVGDINGDGKVDLLDLSILGSKWGQGVQDGDWTNLNPDVDSEVNILDLSILSNNWTG